MSDVMMTRPEKLRRLAWFVPLAGLIYVANALLMRSPSISLVATGTTPPEWPVLFDVLLTVPLLYLFVFRREGRRAVAGAAMLAISGVMIAGWIVPIASQHWLGVLRTGRNLLTATLVLGEIVLAIGLARLTLRQLRDSSDPERAISHALQQRFGDTPVARLLAFEVRMWFYALFVSPRRKLIFAGDEHFTCHAKDGHASNQQGFIVLILIELPLVHVLLTMFWSSHVAWIVTALSLWGLCFLIAEYRATLRRPISLDNERLYIRYGLAAELVLPLTRIAHADAHRKAVARRLPGVRRYCESGVPNVCLHLAPALDVDGLFGVPHSIERIYLGVDAPARFLQQLNARLGLVSLGSA